MVNITGFAFDGSAKTPRRHDTAVPSQRREQTLTGVRQLLHRTRRRSNELQHHSPTDGRDDDGQRQYQCQGLS